MPIKITDCATFETFVAGPNKSAVEALKKAAAEAEPEFYFIFGPHGCGKSHLINALSDYASESHGAPFVLDLSLAHELSPEFLSLPVLPGITLLDNVDAIAGDEAWELALFGFFNRWYDQRPGMLAVTAAISFDRIPFSRSDLNTRMGSGISCPLKILDEASSIEALQLRARVRGFTLPPQTAPFLINHFNRDMRGLMQIFDRLDLASLEERHTLTVPFVKKILGI